MTDLELYTELRKDDDLKHISNEDLLIVAQVYNKCKQKLS